MADVFVAGPAIHIDTDSISAIVATEGYISGVQAGSLKDLKTGATDPGFGLHIVDFLLEPGQGRDQAPEMPYHYQDQVHGNLAKRYIEWPQIATQGGSLSYSVYRGKDFVAVKLWYRWTKAAPGFRTGSLWEQILVFPDGQRHFFSCDRVTSVNDSDRLIFRLDMPGHVKHRGGDSISAVYLSYEGEICSSEFAEDFPPDGRFLYQRDDQDLPERMVRAYRLRMAGGDGPWLGGITLDPGDVYEAWCHQRGYLCFIEEIGGRAVRAGESFGAAYAVGFFDSIDQMNVVSDQLHGKSGIEITGDDENAEWRWVE